MLALFRVDSGLNVGAGHLSRCSVLASGLRAQGYTTSFVSRKLEGSQAISLYDENSDQFWIERDYGFSPESVWSKEEQLFDAEWINKQFLGQKIDLLVVDHYGLDENFETRVGADTVVALDDLHNRIHNAHFIINQAGHSAASYRHLNINQAMRELLGPEYAIVGSEILRARDSYRLEQNDHCLLYFGSGLVGEYVFKAAQRLIGSDFSKITIVLNELDPAYVKVAKLVNENPRMSLYGYINKFAETILTSSLFIGANGATSWERCCIGVPTISFTLAPNQEDIAYILKESNAARVMGPLTDKSLGELSEVLVQFKNPQLLNEMSVNAKRLCDGKGHQRIIQEILRPFLSR